MSLDKSISKHYLMKKQSPTLKNRLIARQIALDKIEESNTSNLFNISFSGLSEIEYCNYLGTKLDVESNNITYPRHVHYTFLTEEGIWNENINSMVVLCHIDYERMLKISQNKSYMIIY